MDEDRALDLSEKLMPRLDPRNPLVIDTRDLVRRPGTMQELTRRVRAPEAIGTDIIAIPAGAPLDLEIRLESVVIALLGTLLGIVLGSFFGWATVTAASDEGLGVLRIPVGQLVIVAVIAALAGVWAARRPAKRAAKLDVLEAIETI